MATLISEEETSGKADCSRPALCPPSFLEMMEARSRGHASPLAANGQSPSSGSQSPVVPPSAVSTGSSSPSTPQPAPQLPLHTPSACPCPPPPTEAPLPPAAPAPRRSIISRLFGTSPAAEAAPSPPGEPQEQLLGRGVWVSQAVECPVSLVPRACKPRRGPPPSSRADSPTAQSHGALDTWEAASLLPRASACCRGPGQSPERGGFHS